MCVVCTLSKTKQLDVGAADVLGAADKGDLGGDGVFAVKCTHTCIRPVDLKGMHPLPLQKTLNISAHPAHQEQQHGTSHTHTV